MTSDMKRQVIDILAKNKKPMRAAHIAKALGKNPNQMTHHLNQLVSQGRVVAFKDGFVTRYAAQLLLTSDKVRDDFFDLIVDSMPRLLPYMDLSGAENETLGFANVVRDMLIRLERDLEKEFS